MSSISNWTSNNDAAVCADPNDELNGNMYWNSWNANQRDLFLLDHVGNLILHQNITSGIPNNLESMIINLIIEIPDENECITGEINNDNPCMPIECYNGQWYEIIIDCAEQMGVPCEGGIYVDPPEDICCSTCTQYGDTNADGSLNIIDIVTMVNLVLENDYHIIADINTDGIINIIDIVQIVNIILDIQ